MNTLAEFIPHLQMDVPGLTDPLARLCLFNAFQHFCRDSEAWRETRTFDIVADQTAYPIYSSFGYSFVKRVGEVKINDGSAQDPSQYTYNGSNILTLKNAVTEASTDGLSVELVVVPIIDSHSGIIAVELNRLDDWRNTIQHGVKYYFYRRSSTFNDGMMRTSLSLFSQGISAANIEATNSEYSEKHIERLTIPRMF